MDTTYVNSFADISKLEVLRSIKARDPAFIYCIERTSALLTTIDMDFWLDIMKVGTLLYPQTKLIAMTTNYMGVAIDNCRAVL